MLKPISSMTHSELLNRIAELEIERNATQQRFEERQRVLTSVSRMLSSSLDYEATLQSAAHLALPALADWCSVLLSDGHKLQRVARASAFAQDTNALSQMQSTISNFDVDSRDNRVLSDGQIELRSDFDEDELMRLAVNSDHEQALRDLGTCSMIRAPLIARERTLGLIVFAYSHSGRHYTPEDVPLIEEIAHSAAFVIENARLYHSSQRKVAELSTIQRIASIINSTATLATVFQDMVTIVSNAFGYRMLSIYLLDGEYLRLQAHIGYEQVISTIHISQGVSGRVIRTGKLIFTRDSSQDPDFIQAFAGISQGISAPLRATDGSVNGIIVLESVEPILTDQDVAILELVADQISVAVANARLFEALRASEQRYRALIDQAADAILLTNEEWVITDANIQALHMFGDQRKVLLGQQLQKRSILEATSAYWPPLPGTVFQIRTSSGGVCPVEASFNSVVENDQTHHIIILRDISERLRAEELQRATQRQLIEGQKLESLGVLVGGIAHDFNNLLMAILGNAGLARLELPDNAEAHTSLIQIEAAARRAVDLTQQMLAYAGKVHLQREPVSLSVIVEGISPLMRSMIQRAIIIECQLDPNIPLILADSSQIRRVVLSLVTNAAEAIGEHPGVISISTSSMTLTDEQVESDEWGKLQPGMYAVLMVRDTGSGIEATVLPKIFDPFFSTKVAGHGLGLSAAQGIMRTHRGLLRVVSTINQGSCFTMLLPTAPASEPSIIGK